MRAVKRCPMSALPPKADIRQCEMDVRFVLIADNELHLQKNQDRLKGCCRSSAGLSAHQQVWVNLPNHILGVKNDDPIFFFARINSHAQGHTYENQLRGRFAEYFLLFATRPDDLACLGAFVRNGHRHDIVLCRLTDLSIDSKPVGALSLGSNRKPFLSKSSVTNIASFRLLKLLRRLKDINIAEASRYLP